ncbi:MAG: phospholipase A [Flavobacterium sp.]|nr:phospholipase A [Pedobacter sp.]
MSCKIVNLNKVYPVIIFIIIILSEVSLPLFSLKAQENEKSGFLRKSTTMAERWELGAENHKGLFLITPYRPVFITAGRWSDNPNEKPTSENPAYTFPFKIPYNNYEAKFQLSFKTKIARKLFWGNGDIWIAYSQKAHWQIYNQILSRPFRELNYEPEIILNFATNYKLLGLNGRMLGVIFNHQSNGKIVPLSRSWNRVIVQAGFEKNNWQVTLRPSFRIKDEIDENPAIADYAGRAEANIVYNAGKHQFSSLLAHSMKFNNGGRGSVQVSWAFPVINNFHGMLQLSDGYAETLMDYNHRQTTIGLSVSLVEW